MIKSSLRTLSVDKSCDIRRQFKFVSTNFSLSFRPGIGTFIEDYSDYLFGNANSLSEKERDYLAILGKALEKSQSYNLLTDSFAEIGNVVIIVAKKSA